MYCETLVGISTQEKLAPESQKSTKSDFKLIAHFTNVNYVFFPVTSFLPVVVSLQMIAILLSNKYSGVSVEMTIST